ncbi:MAG: PEPxxWA-CTERM sorting domain-containing protein [Sphingomonadaceae bacterium]
MRFRYLAALAVVGIASSAAGQGLDVLPGAVSSVGTRSGTTIVEGTNLSYFQAGTPRDGGGFEASVDIDDVSISFRNGGIGLGAFSRIESTTNLNMVLTNWTAAPLVLDSFESLIIPAGFGFFVTTPVPPCGPLTPFGCGTGRGIATFQDVSRPGDLEPSVELGRVGFDFSVRVDGVEVFALSAGLTLVFDPNSGSNVFLESFGNAPTVLQGWTLVTAEGNQNAIGYAWDATPFVVSLPDPVIAVGDSRTVSYVSTVYSESFADNTDLFLALLGYSAFGDPVGRPGGGGGGDFAEPFSGLQGLSEGISGIEIGSFRFAQAYYENGRLFLPLDPPGGIIPEPGTWALLIAGFGLVGGALRRRRTLIA